MENPDKNTTQPDNEDTNPIKSDPTSGGRNSNDNFNDDKVDDYGIDYSKPGAEEDLEYRISVKGGRGPKGGKRNPNDNFDDDPDNTNEDDYKA